MVITWGLEKIRKMGEVWECPVFLIMSGYKLIAEAVVKAVEDLKKKRAGEPIPEKPPVKKAKLWQQTGSIHAAVSNLNLNLERGYGGQSGGQEGG
jgi:hypothetical protein